jgi:peptide/nickel transport system substrate-binding protein
VRRSLALGLLLLLAVCASTTPASAAPSGTVTWGVHVSLAPTFFDPAEATGTALPLMVYYAAATGSCTSSRCARASPSTTATR